MQTSFWKKTIILIFTVFITGVSFYLTGCGGSGSKLLLEADGGGDLTISVNSYVILDGSSSFDSGDAVLSYLWTIESKPEGSEASLTGASSVDP